MVKVKCPYRVLLQCFRLLKLSQLHTLKWVSQSLTGKVWDVSYKKFVHVVSRVYNNHLTVSKPLVYLKQIMTDSALNFVDIFLSHVPFQPSTTLHMDKIIGHMTSDTRHSHFQHATVKNWEWQWDYIPVLLHTSFICWKSGVISRWFQYIYCVDFIENTLYGDICWSPLPSSLLDQLSMLRVWYDSASY